MSDKLDRLIDSAKSRKSSETLYGVSPCHFANLTYKGALLEKIRLGKLLLKDLMKDEFWYMNKRVDIVDQAISFNHFLLDEIKQCKGI